MARAAAGPASTWRTSGRQLFLLAALAGATCGCAALGRPAHVSAATPPPHVVTSTVMLHGSPLELHLATPAVPASGTLVLYATGDGGWFGAAIDMFRSIAGAGFRTVGFSARAFLRLERPPHRRLDPHVLAADYALIAAQARVALALPDGTPVILAGWSRGAAFAAIAAAEPVVRATAKGVVAIGLAADETLRLGADDDDDGTAAVPTRRPGAIEPYARLRALAPLRCAVVQSSHDDYLPAPQAQVLFGGNSASQHFYAVPARNHRFSGGYAAFVQALADALSWVDGAAPNPP